MDGVNKWHVRSCFPIPVHDVLAPHAHVVSLWRIKVPPRVIAFGWLALLRDILTMDNLWGDEWWLLAPARCSCRMRNLSTICWLITSQLNPYGKRFWGGSNTVDPSVIPCHPCFNIGRWKWGWRHANQCGSSLFWRQYGLLGKWEIGDVSKDYPLMKNK